MTSKSPLTAQLAEFLDRLDSGAIQLKDARILDSISSDDVIAGLGKRYPAIFQERSIGSKKEIGLCRSVQSQRRSDVAPGSVATAVYIVPMLDSCVFVSLYHEAISELTATKSITIAPSVSSDHLNVEMGAGIKLDRTPDGWVMKKLKACKTDLSRDFLEKRGWRLELMVPHLHRATLE